MSHQAVDIESRGKTLQRLRVVVRGAVQGVGFRPFVYRLATSLQLRGWVLNSAEGVFIEVEGEPEPLASFRQRIESEAPPRALIQEIQSSILAPEGFEHFTIRHSDGSGSRRALILPDLATCADCLRELFDPTDRRYRYPFTNCTNCGPRYSILEALPYDRPNTTMRGFILCKACQREYEDPLDRRFHAQPTACPRCGPQLALWTPRGRVLAVGDNALRAAEEAIREGQVVALKGLGGFQLLVDARNDDAIWRLRARKQRPDKPLALMMPSLDAVRAHCSLSELDEALLCSPEAPIVLLPRRSAELPASLAPGNRTLGVMLPYTPLHHLLLSDLGFPVVATSGNLTDEPICTDEQAALARLGHIADFFLVHDRPIARHVDDSIVRVMAGRTMVLRRARGYAPLPIPLEEASPTPLLAVGAHLKNSVALAVDTHVFISQHIGELETTQALDAFRRTISELVNLYESAPSRIACDLHPAYTSTHYAREQALPLVRVQHHYAHALACMAEHGLKGSVLAVPWDGTGYGTDGSIWGGEFLRITEGGFERVGYLRPFPLPGGERAIREPRRAALGLLFELFGEALFARDIAPIRAFTPEERRVLRTMLERGLNSPRTSSVGRLFDAVASLLDLCQRSSFEGQAAIALEEAMHESASQAAYAFGVNLTPLSPRVLDWGPVILDLLHDLRCDVPVTRIATKFHNALIEAIVGMAELIGERRVLLTGGCFQNRALLEGAVQQLRATGFQPYWPELVPPNDGGIALGQIMAALRALREEQPRCV